MTKSPQDKILKHIRDNAKLSKTEPLSKPPVSEAQRKAMGAAASGNSTLGIPKSVGKEFIDADKGGKLPEVKKEEKKHGSYSTKHIGTHKGCGGDVDYVSTSSIGYQHCTKCKASSLRSDLHGVIKDDDTKKAETESKAKYETCPDCEANFKLKNGEAFPQHRAFGSYKAGDENKRCGMSGKSLETKKAELEVKKEESKPKNETSSRAKWMYHNPPELSGSKEYLDQIWDAHKKGNHSNCGKNNPQCKENIQKSVMSGMGNMPKVKKEEKASKYSFDEVKHLPMEIVSHMHKTGSISRDVHDKVLTHKHGPYEPWKKSDAKKAETEPKKDKTPECPSCKSANTYHKGDVRGIDQYGCNNCQSKFGIKKSALEKGMSGMGNMPKEAHAQASQDAFKDKATGFKLPVKKLKMPSPEQHSDRANSFADFMPTPTVTQQPAKAFGKAEDKPAGGIDKLSRWVGYNPHSKVYGHASAHGRYNIHVPSVSGGKYTLKFLPDRKKVGGSWKDQPEQHLGEHATAQDAHAAAVTHHNAKAFGKAEESDFPEEGGIIHQKGRFWVKKTKVKSGDAHEVWEDGATHAKRRVITSLGPDRGRNEAITRANKLHAESLETKKAEGPNYKVPNVSPNKEDGTPEQRTAEIKKVHDTGKNHWDSIYNVTYHGPHKNGGRNYKIQLHSATGPTHWAHVHDNGQVDHYSGGGISAKKIGSYK